MYTEEMPKEAHQKHVDFKGTILYFSQQIDALVGEAQSLLT
jgi:hypothetical protein